VRFAATADDVAPMIAAAAGDPAPQLLVIDDADLVDDADGRVARLLAGRRPDVHVVIAARPEGLRGRYADFTQDVRRSRQGLLLRPDCDSDGDLVGTPLPRRGPTRFGAGRGYLVRDGQCELVQAARR
jgi:S-DNA-T family DNA segregation ATPase FtsK/SpoIIIE